MNITYEEYKTALDIVLKYQKQILIWDKKVKKIGGSVIFPKNKNI